MGAVVLAVVLTAGAARQGPSEGGTTDVDRALMPVLMGEGQEVFGAECAECHNDTGSGVGPSFASNAAMGSKERVIRRILEGTPDGGMPTFAASMSDRQVAAVSTFIRNSWDNAYGLVTEADVRTVRTQLKKP